MVIHILLILSISLSIYILHPTTHLSCYSSNFQMFLFFCFFYKAIQLHSYYTPYKGS